MALARRGDRLTALLDTNVLIRHLTGDPPDLAEKAARLLTHADRLILTDVIAAECVHVLSSFYELPAPRVAEALRSAMAMPSVETPNHDLLLRALELFEYFGLGFADCYLVASAEALGVKTVASFDRGIDRIDSVRRIEAV